MGTYSTNKNLFMPSVGETGWGTLVNNNFSTIDTFLKPITVSGSTYTFTGNHVGNQSGGSISATSISNSGTLTNTGKITANGGLAGGAISGTTGTFSGNITSDNLTPYGIKYKLLLKNSNTDMSTIHIPTHSPNALQSNGYYSLDSGQTVYLNAGQSTTHKVFFGTGTAVPGHTAYVEPISGAWEYGLYITTADIVASINGISGITETGKTISVSQFNQLLSGIYSVTFNNPSSYQRQGRIQLRIYNRGSTNQYISIVPSALDI